MIKRLHDISLFTLFFSIALLLGKHFWPDFSYVEGVRVDYLSPTLYFSDLAILFFVLTTFILYRKSIVLTLKKTSLLVVLFVLLLLTSSLISKQAHASLYGIVKLIEFGLLALCLAVSFQKRQLKIILLALCLVVVITSILAVLQLHFNHSVNGVFYFFGERNFSQSTINIAKFGLNGKTIVRPYSTFPHPNVFAYFLFFTSVMLSYNAVYLSEYKRIVYLSSIISIIVLPFTFARVISFTFLLYLTHYLRLLKAKPIVWAVLTALVVLFLVIFYSRFVDSHSLEVKNRVELVKITLQMLQNHSLFGVGLNNFFYSEVLYQKKISPIFLQPVHNIYLLWFVQVGILSGVLSVVFLLKTYRRIHGRMRMVKSLQGRAFYTSCFILFLSSLFFGLSDHFIISLQQAQIIFAIILGLCWNRNIS